MRDPVTLITTIRNGDRFLDRYFANLADILSPQDHAVIVDDGSDDPVILPDALRTDRRISLLSPGRIGRGAALNLAIENSPTDLLAIQDVDDLSHPARLDLQGRFLTGKSSVLLFARDTADRPPFPGKLARPVPPARLYLSNPLHHSTLALHRRLWEQAGGYATDIPCCIDLDFYLRACCLDHVEIRRLEKALITRNRDPANRFFATIPPERHHMTRRNILMRYRKHLPASVWFALAWLHRKAGTDKGGAS